MISAKKALALWKEQGLLTDKQVQKLEESLEDESHGSAVRIFSVIGACLTGLGVILFIASHWGDMSPLVKTILLMLGIVSTGYSGYYLTYERKGYERIGNALLFLNLLVFGASIFLVGQLYNLPLTFWWGALLWCIVAVYFAYTFQSKLHLWTAVPLLLLFIGWLRTAQVTGFGSQFDFIGNQDSTIFTIIPLVGISLLSLSIVHHAVKSIRFGTDTLRHWGIFLVLLPVTIATAERSVLFEVMRLRMDSVSIGLAILALLSLASAYIFGAFQSKDGKFGLGATAVYVLCMYALAAAPALYYQGDVDLSRTLLDAPVFTGLFILSILLTFVFTLVTIWFGTLLKEPAMVNLGMIAVVILITIQYFTWAFSLLDRSLFFVLGGILILSLSTGLERKRRQLLSSMK